jgi:hypothetical protein
MLELRLRCRLQPFNATLSHDPCFDICRLSTSHVNTKQAVS